MSNPLQIRMNKMALKVTAAEGFHMAKLTEFHAGLAVLDAKNRQSLQDAAVASFEAMLDVYQERARFMLEIQDINPDWRENA